MAEKACHVFTSTTRFGLTQALDGSTMATMKIFAQYVLVLEQCALSTKRAEDRPVYQSLLADAAVVLATVVASETTAALTARIDAHERLWGHIWLQDPVVHDALSAWSNAKKTQGQAAI